ncbi:MAG: LPS export ABC transporter periplasmic protein LptC [Flavobacteriaceae bacterium]|nr:LPS export ABC transporter periplasmic protein LptC [Flavobacteriaceae bacterium]
MRQCRFAAKPFYFLILSKYILKSFQHLSLFAGLALASCQNNTGKKGFTITPNMPGEKGEGISVIYTDSGNLRAKLFTPLIENYHDIDRNPYLEMKKGLTVFFYTANKYRPESMLKADHGIKYEKQKKVVLQRNVVVVNLDHDTLNTELLIWDELTRKIHSDKFVRIKKKDEILFGEGFESNEDFTDYKIFKIKGSLLRKNEESE